MSHSHDSEEPDNTEEAQEQLSFFQRFHNWFLGGEPEHGRFKVTPTAESHFSWLRTRMSMERTLMSWVRTSTALIGFGFTIVQFFHGQLNPAGPHVRLHPEMPRYMGLALIASGVFALIVSIWQYRAFGRYLWSKDFKQLTGPARAPIETPVFGVAICLVLIGCYAFLAVLIRAV